MICEVFQDYGNTNMVIEDVVKIEDANNQITITDVHGGVETETIIPNNVYFEIVATPPEFY